MTLDEASEYVRAGLDEGVTCPCCSQFCKIYRRKIYRSMAEWLLWIVREFEAARSWIDIRDSAVRGGDYAKLGLWGLIRSEIEYERARDSATAGRSGMWAPTLRGIRFAKGEITVPRHVYVFDDRVLRFSPESVAISDCLPSNFDFREAWGAAPAAASGPREAFDHVGG